MNEAETEAQITSQTNLGTRMRATEAKKRVECKLEEELVDRIESTRASQGKPDRNRQEPMHRYLKIWR